MNLNKNYLCFLWLGMALIPAMLNAQVRIDDERIILNMYKNISQIDTIVEKGRYTLAAMHNKDIVELAIWKNKRKLKHIVWEDSKAPLYGAIRSKLIKPILHYGRGTVYLIEIQLEGENDKRRFRIQTRHPKTKKPGKNELGTPMCSVCPSLKPVKANKQEENE